jgi:hypothetical protein
MPSPDKPMEANQLIPENPLYRLQWVLAVTPAPLLQLEDAFALPGYLSEVFIKFGAIVLIIGSAAFLVSAPRSRSRAYGRWLLISGIIITIVGFDFNGIVGFIRSLM